MTLDHEVELNISRHLLPMVRTVAVIGAGASGLAAVKCCLDEGLEPMCFEKSNDIGGLWRYSSKVEEGRTTVMKNTIANVSKEMTVYSDFPPPQEYPIYMHNKHLCAYLNLYADKFGLKKYIRLNYEVMKVDEADDGRWHVTVKGVSSGNTEKVEADAVLVCTGLFVNPHIPKYPGMADFQGQIVHTQQYKDSSGYEGKRTLVAGIGNSAVDAAVDISDVAEQVYISTRNGSWIITRLSKHGDPVDMAGLTRFNFRLVSLFPDLLNKVVMKECNSRFDHKRYGINPKIAPDRSTITVNDQLAFKLLIGAIKMKPEIECFTTSDVKFVDGSRVNNIDTVVFGTGYTPPTFPFLDENVFGSDKTKLYLCMFPPKRTKQTIAAIGCFRNRGTVLPVVEIQARLATRVFKNQIRLPDEKKMLERINAHVKESSERRVYSLTSFSQIDFFPYMDELATFIGCKPNFAKLFVTDPALALKCFFGPGTSYQYRLVGPGAWSGAREAIFSQWGRTYYSLNEGKCPASTDKTDSRAWSLIAFFALAAGFVLLATNFVWQ